MKAREYVIMLEAVEKGVFNGMSLYNKLRDIPISEEEELMTNIVHEVMHEISEYFIWEDMGDEA